MGFARNTGLENVTSDYVIFIDSDDYIDSDFLEITDVSLVEKIIRAYPDKQLNIKQRGFVLMVRWKWNWLLYVMFCIFKIE